MKTVRDDGKKIKNKLEPLDTDIRREKPVSTSIMLISIPSAEMPSDSLT